MKVAANTVVALEYSLHLGDGVIVDQSEEGEPLSYLHGVGQLVPGLESKLAGMSVGESLRTEVAPADGYGMRDPEEIREMPRSMFGNHDMTVGDELVVVDQDDNHVPIRIEAIKGDTVLVDFNHPLAGKTLHFSVKVLEIRAATEEELEHGHAHGGDGHEH